MRVHVVSVSFAELDAYWEEQRRRDRLNEQTPRLAREGDRVRLTKDASTPGARHRPARRVRAGTTGIVLRNTGSLLRVQFSDADVMDEAVVSAYDVTVVTEPDDV